MTIDHRTIAQQWTKIILDTVLDDIDDIDDIKRATPVVQDLIDSVRKTEKIKTKKIVDDVKDSLFKIQRMGIIDFKGEKLEVITRYQAVNTINLSGLPYTSISKQTNNNTTKEKL